MRPAAIYSVVDHPGACIDDDGQKMAKAAMALYGIDQTPGAGRGARGAGRGARGA